MSLDQPLVSIGMPVRNCQLTVKMSIDSIIMQTYDNWELIIINDGSTDNTFDIIKSYNDDRIKIYSSERSYGLPYQLNRAIIASAGKYFARMDGDDISYPNRLEMQIKFMERNCGIDLVGSSILVFNSNGMSLGKRVMPITHSVICRSPYSGFPIAHPTFLGRLDWFKKYYYRIGAVRCEDQDLLLRSFRDSKFANVDMILLGYREDRIDISKTYIGRKSWVKSVNKDKSICGKRGLPIMTAAEQLCKLTVDYLAVKTNLNYFLLRNRATKVLNNERDEWANIWKQVNCLGRG
ncbi:MAG: glycosyltransferase family A protein [Pseudomonadota bacterium]